MNDDSPNVGNGAQPSLNGRGQNGRFLRGNGGGPGNPLSAKCNRLRSAMLRSVSPQDMRDLIAKLIELGKNGDVSAIKEVLTRSVGPAISLDLVERLERVEALLGAQKP